MQKVGAPLLVCRFLLKRFCVEVLFHFLVFTQGCLQLITGHLLTFANLLPKPICISMLKLSCAVALLAL